MAPLLMFWNKAFKGLPWQKPVTCPWRRIRCHQTKRSIGIPNSGSPLVIVILKIHVETKTDFDNLENKWHSSSIRWHLPDKKDQSTCIKHANMETLCVQYSCRA